MKSPSGFLKITKPIEHKRLKKQAKKSKFVVQDSEESDHDDDGDGEGVHGDEDMDVGGSMNFDNENLQDTPVISDVDATTVPPVSEPEPTPTSESNPSISESQQTPPISNTETPHVSVSPNTSVGTLF